MLRNFFVVGLLGMASAGSAFAAPLPSCGCAPGSIQLTDAALVTALSNKMACAVVGQEEWQEFHQGATAAGGNLIDYKKGPTDPVDPSATVGTWAILDSTQGSPVQYTYGVTSYKYTVCAQGANTHFCGAQFGGRDIMNAKVGGSGGSPQSCASIP